MMSSLSERLQALGVKIGTANLPKPKEREKNPFPISSVLPGDLWQTRYGDVFVVETRYKADFQVGKVKLSPISALDMVAAWAKEPSLNECSLEQFIFIDTETTGLAGGTGTYTFLIGAGKFEADHFRLAQFFLSDPGEETAQLAAFEEFVSSSKAVVSFNGKAFDLPLINTRYIINGWPSPLKHTPHIDLLHLARRLWKDRLTSRALGDLEWNILGARRSEQDVPGWMVADLYLDYLHTGDARPLRGVFYHNEIDVLSLAALLNHISSMLSNPLDEGIQYAQDRMAIGKLYADLGYMDEAARIYQRSLEYDSIDQDLYWNAIFQLSFIHKKRGDLQAAAILWEQAAKNKHLYAFEELAKLCEHVDRDFRAALDWTENAIQLIMNQDLPVYIQTQWQESLTHRKKRLKRKLNSKQQRKP